MYQPTTIFELADRFVDEFNGEANVALLLDFVYWTAFRHQMQNDIDMTKILQVIENKFDHQGMKPRHLFSSLSVQTVVQRKEFFDKVIEPWVDASLHDLIPDEIVILLNQLGKLNDGKDLIKKTAIEIQENYVLANLA